MSLSLSRIEKKRKGEERKTLIKFGFVVFGACLFSNNRE